MHPILFISIVILAVAIMAFVVFLAMAIPSLLKTVTVMQETAERIQKDMEKLNTQKDVLLMHVATIQTDMEWKVDQMKSVVRAVKGTGDSVSQIQYAAKRLTSTIVHDVSSSEETQVKTVQYSEMAMGFLDRSMNRNK